MPRKHLVATWFARLAVGFVFAVNLNCALAFILQPERYAPGFEISGVPGTVAVQGFGLLFLMWNATYPPVILQPDRNRMLYWVILSQQSIGVIGETWLWLQLPAGHAALAATGLRFILFDGFGLVLMGTALLVLRLTRSLKKKNPKSNERCDTQGIILSSGKIWGRIRMINHQESHKEREKL